MIGGQLIRDSGGGGSFCAGLIDVTCEAAGIVGGGIVIERLMRIVAGNAGEARVGLRPTLAVFEAVGGEADVGVDEAKVGDNILPGAVAGAAEIYGRDGIEAGGIHDQSRGLIGLCGIHGDDMAGAWPVAGFAGDARYGAISVQLIVGD